MKNGLVMLWNPMTDSSPADNVVNDYCERSSRINNTSRSSTPVSMQQMVTGEMTVGTMNNNNYSSNRVVIQSYIKSMLIQSLISQ
jgi:hypothetical protein